MRIQRSVLAVPASNRRMIEKAATRGADVVLLDLEDAVAPSAKVAARDTVVWAVRELDWGNTSIGYRVNGLASPLFYRDVIDVVERVGDRIDLIVVPKVQRPEDIHTVDTLLSQVERGLGFVHGRIALHALVESAAGLLSVEGIARAVPRLEALIFDPGDFAASMRMPSTSIGVADEWDALYPGHRFHDAMSRIAVAARACGLGAIDGPVATLRDPTGLRRSCLIARSLGYEGKWCIHPAQIPIVHEVFTPTDDEVRRARAVIEAYEQAVESGAGAIARDGTMIDGASIRMAEATLDVAQRGYRSMAQLGDHSAASRRYTRSGRATARHVIRSPQGDKPPL